MTSRPALFQQGEFTLSSGQPSTWKVECDALTPDDWAGLARIAMERWDLQFGHVVGVPTGGLPFADALRGLFSETSARTLVVDDVLTTGDSMRAAMADHPHSIGLVAFARGPLPPNVMAIWHAGEPPVEGALEKVWEDFEREHLMTSTELEVAREAFDAGAAARSGHDGLGAEPEPEPPRCMCGTLAEDRVHQPGAHGSHMFAEMRT